MQTTEVCSTLDSLSDGPTVNKTQEMVLHLQYVMKAGGGWRVLQAYSERGF